MNILFFTHAEPKFLPPVFLEPQECICGPFYNNWRTGGRWKYLSTPGGVFEAKEVIDKLGSTQSPDLILVHADASRGCLPQNLPKQVRKVLLVGGATHILQNPLQSLISYALQEGFETVVVWNRHNAHFFKQFGIPNVFWMPGLIFAIPEVPIPREKRNQMCFFGQLGPYHPRRNRIIKELQQKKIPIVGGKLPRMDSLELAARSLVSLNISLNGELNLRVFESTAMGALLLTDKLSPHTGLELFFEDGESMMTYDSTQDLIHKILEISKDASQAKAIAARGKRVTDEFFSFSARHRDFFNLLSGGQAPEAFRLIDEPRCQLPPVEPDYKDSLILRLQLYEMLQELHRTLDQVSVNLTEGVHPLILSDAGDLFRLHQSLYIDPVEFVENWQAAMQELMVTNLETKAPHTLEVARGDVLITSIPDLEKETVQRSIQNKNHKYLVISDWFIDPDKRYEDALRSLNYECRKESVFGLFEVC